MSADTTSLPETSAVVENDDSMEVDKDGVDDSLTIPITSSTTSEGLFVEIFPEELRNLPSSTILRVLKDEKADLDIWAKSAHMYLLKRQSRESSREASAILQAACDQPDFGSQKNQQVRILASAGIALLTQAQQSQATPSGGIRRAGGDTKDELRSMADSRFTNASNIDTFFPMTWIGRGMLNLNYGRLTQAKFFFDTALKQCGPVLPALLGMAAVLHGEQKYEGAQEMFARAIKRYPEKSGAATRVGFGIACYHLGQVDRAKAAFDRALDMDRENVEAMVGSAILDMASLDETSKDFNSRNEKAIKTISMANLLDHSNAMVQNHLANHYFWKWAPVPGVMEVTEGSKIVNGSQPIPLDPGERVRIGTHFETYVEEDEDGDNEDDEGITFRIRDAWKDASASGQKVWKKDYDRVIALAKGAYASTNVEEIQAESLFFLARVYHVREEIDLAYKHYVKSCKLAPKLPPAHFGLAQVLVMMEKYDEAIKHLKIVIEMSPKATDALALLGLLKVHAASNIQGKNAKDEKRKDGKSGRELTPNLSGKNAQEEGLSYMKKAIDIDPLNPDLIVLEALSLQQYEGDYAKALARYNSALTLMKRKGKKVPFEIYVNIGVLCQETSKHEEAAKMYKLAFIALDEDGTAGVATLDNKGIEGGKIVLKDNEIFFGYVDTTLKLERTSELVLKVLKLSGEDISNVPLDIGDHVRIGESFECEITNIESKENSFFVHLNKKFDIEEDNKENNEQNGEKKR